MNATSCTHIHSTTQFTGIESELGKPPHPSFTSKEIFFTGLINSLQREIESESPCYDHTSLPGADLEVIITVN
jgi:hypothetical protein